MLKYESKEQVKSSKINNSKEDLIEESEQKMKIELKNIIKQKINSIKIEEKENIPENICSNNSNIFRGNKRRKEKKENNNSEINSELSKDSTMKKIIQKEDKNLLKYEIINEKNKKLITTIKDWNGYNYIRWKGGLIIGPCSFRFYFPKNIFHNPFTNYIIILNHSFTTHNSLILRSGYNP